MKLSTDEVTDIVAPQVLEFLSHTFLTMTDRISFFLTVQISPKSELEVTVLRALLFVFENISIYLLHLG